MVYELLSAVGGIGLLAQTVLGFAHGGHADGQGGVHMHGHVHLHSHALENIHTHGHLHTGAGPAHGPDAPHTGHHDHATQQGVDAKGSPLAPLYALLSPLAIFTICLGAGVTGLLMQMQVHQQMIVALSAVAGGLGLYYVVVRPLWTVILRFASTPAATLSAAVAQEAEADSRFDGTGKGIVRLNVDGQTIRVLAHLEPDDVAQGAVITTGDKLVVTKIDRQRNTCQVTRI